LRWKVKITRYPEKFGDYRYRLRVEFTEQDDEFNRGNLVFVMRNPATVLEESDLSSGSRTRRRLIKFARAGRYRTMTEVNLFAYRCPEMAELVKAVQEQGISAVGPENDQVISEAVQEADKIIVGWGRVHNHRFAERAGEVAELLKGSGKQLYCLGKNNDGSPMNPARGRYIVQAWP
jgi:hypothetical protein